MRAVSHQPISGEIPRSEQNIPVPELPSPSVHLPDSETRTQLRELEDSDIVGSSAHQWMFQSSKPPLQHYNGLGKDSSKWIISEQPTFS